MTRLLDLICRRHVGPAMAFSDAGLAAASDRVPERTPPSPVTAPAPTTASTHILIPPRAAGCTFANDDWHRCVNESGQPSTLTCHATQTRRTITPQEVAS